MDKKKLNWEIILLFAILIFAFFLRVYSLGNAPLWVDESISAMASKNILLHGTPSLDSGADYGSALIFHYLQAFFMLFGQSEFFARFVSVIFGILTILLVYFIGKEYSKSAGIFCALFMSVFFMEVFFSRQARFYQLFQLAFFASLYFLYKSKEKLIYLLPALVCFFAAIDTHLEGLILAPFFILYILYFNKKQWFLSIFPAIPLIGKLIPASRLSTVSIDAISDYASQYFSYFGNTLYLLILFVPGLIWGFIRKKRLTLTLIIPALVTLIGVFSLQTFALRYVYFFVFPLLLFSGLLFSFLYDRYGKLMLVPIFILLLVPSNLFFPFSYVNVIKPISYNYNDISAPETNYKLLPAGVLAELRSNTTLVSFFSADLAYYVRSPDYAIDFSMTGMENGTIATNFTGKWIDVYSGAKILNISQKLAKPYNVVADSFSLNKLNPERSKEFSRFVENCSIAYDNGGLGDLKIYECSA